jgi:hypothetical protein
MGNRPVDALARLRSDPLSRDLARLYTFVSPSLANAIGRALAVKEKERPQSISALRALIWPQPGETLVLGSQSALDRNVVDEVPREANERETRHFPGNPEPLRRKSLGKYTPLYEHLLALKDREWRATFSELEAVLGFHLPPAARKHRPWWGNVRTNTTHRHAVAWRSAGWKVDQVDIGSEKVVFAREGRSP